MDFGQDTHLCLRCGKTIDGLDNYVIHRQKKCLQPSASPSFSIDSSPEPPIPYTSSSQDIYKLSASDFFLNLNLQYNAKPAHTDASSNSVKNSSSTNDSFSSKLDIPSLESDINSVLPNEKPLIIDDDNNCLDLALSNDKWENFKINNQLNVNNLECSKQKNCDSKKETFFAGCNGVSNKVSLKCSKKKALKKYLFPSFSSLNVPRTSYRQKVNANDRMLCCDGKQDYYECLLCNHKYSFSSTFLDHLLICSKKQSDINSWKQEIFKNSSLFVLSSHFKCLLCSFYCTDSFMFLNHLKAPSHRQKTASLKNPLICLPCQDECSASDEMREHFSKCHLHYKRGDHPVIIIEKKRNHHCCYCLTLIKSSTHLQNSNIKDLQRKEDISFITTSLPNVCACACGVDKPMLNNFLEKTSPLITSKSPDLSNNLPIDECVENTYSFKIQKADESDVDEESNNNCTDADIYNKNDLPLKTERLPIIAKITSKNGKFTYKKVRVPDLKKDFTCCWCGVEYISKITLQLHLNKCSSKKKKVTKICLIKNKQNSSANLCEDDKRYLCDKCPYIGKSFNQLTRHSRSHSGEKPYKCPHCTYSSSLSSQLVRHKRLHTGQKPYKCPYCSYTCNTQENLRKHILKTKKHRGKMMYPCQHCIYESNEFSDFKSHLSKVHSIEFPNGITMADSPEDSDKISGL